MMRWPPDAREWERIGRLAALALRRLDRQLSANENGALASKLSTRGAMVTDQGEAAAGLDRIERAVASLASEAERRFEAEVVEPLVRRALPAVDLLTDSLLGGDEGQAAIIGAQCELLELLAGYGIEPLRARRSAAFDPRWMRPEQFRSTSHQRQHMTVAAMTRLGFRRDQRVLRPTAVVVFKYKEPSSHDRSD